MLGLSALATLAGCTPPAKTPAGVQATPAAAPTTPPALTATGSLARTPVATPNPSPTPTSVLRLATNHAPIELPWLRKALESFGRDRVAVEVVNTTTGYLGQIASWAADGKLPSVIYVRGQHAAAWDYKGWITPLDDLIRRDESEVATRDLYQTVLPEVRRNDRWLMLPTSLSVAVLFGNAGAFRAADVEPPKGDWDWSALLDTARRVGKGARGNGIRWGLSWRPDHVDLAAAWRAADPATVPADGRGLVIDGGGSAAVVQSLADLALVDKAAPTDAELISGAVAFETGSVAIEGSGSWAASRYRTTPRASAVVALPPRGAAGQRSVAVTTAGWALTRDSHNRDNAWTLLKHLTGRDAIDLMVTLPMRDLPARQSSAALWLEGLRAVDGPGGADAIVRLASEAVALPTVPWWMEFQDACDEYLPMVWAGQKKAADVLSEIQARANTAARRFG